MSAEHPEPADIERMLSDPKSKAHSDLRDRAAYMHITGAHPTHLRRWFTRALTMISSLKAGSGIAGNGSLRVTRDAVRRLRLDGHPMVVKVRQLIAEGYQLRVSLGPNARRGYGKIRLWRDDDKRTVQIDGSVKDGWDRAEAEG